jgi:hypothetical protein
MLKRSRLRTQMDTVGDAYVVIGLSDDEDGLSDLCREMMMLAKNMIIALEDFSSSIGEEVHTRLPPRVPPSSLACSSVTHS